jgi:hypothetical protein
MTRFTERLLQAGAIVVLLYLGWQLAQTSVIGYYTALNRAAVAEQQLQQCLAGSGSRPQ